MNEHITEVQLSELSEDKVMELAKWLFNKNEIKHLNYFDIADACTEDKMIKFILERSNYPYMSGDGSTICDDLWVYVKEILNEEI